MVYNDEANDLDCVSEVLLICRTTIAQYTIKQITRRFNSALDKYFTLAFESDGRANFDDINETSPPIDTQDIASGTNRYKLSAFTETILNLLKLELLDGDADIVPLLVDTFDELKDRGETFDDIYVNCDSGTPTKYIVYGDFIYLNAKPDWSEVKGLLAYFDRPAVYMTITDTTKVPGVPVVHHTALCRMTALPFMIENNMKSAGAIAQLVAKDEEDIKMFFARRNKDQKQQLTPLVENCR